MAIPYTIDIDGTVTQQDPDGVWRVHTLTGAEAKLFDDKVARWAGLAYDNEARVGVPMALTLATILAESGGNPDAEGPPSDHGLGLMMITAQALKQGLSDAEVMIPENNIRLGTDFIAKNAAQIGGVWDPVQLASMFNAGSTGHGPHTNDAAPWGVSEYRTPDGQYPYISRVVRANNYAIANVNGIPGLGIPTLGSFFAFAVIGWYAFEWGPRLWRLAARS